jgi:hypothetical protein
LGYISTSNEDEFRVEIGRTKKKQFNEYVEKCHANGFSLDSYRTDSFYRADNDLGYHLEILHNSSYDYMTITIETPINSREYQWPRSEIARLIPPPNSNMGRIEWEASYGFVIYVGNTTKADYDEYVDACADSGFSINYQKGNDYYYADNEAGYHLSIKYEGNDSIFIRIDEPDKQEEAISTESPSPELAASESPSRVPSLPTSSSAKPTDTDTVSWRDFLAEYETWMDHYIEVVLKYNENPTDITIMGEYLALMGELAEWAEKADQVEEELVNNTEALKEYLEVQTRVLQKLIDAQARVGG